jgi:hypothetical protein
MPDITSVSPHLHPDRLEKYSFWWSEARLVIGAVSLIYGAVPVLVRFALPWGLLSTLLTLSWIISGLASGYLLYRWLKGGQTVFGGKDQKDLVAFWVSVVSGINLGLTGLTKNNLGMSVFSGQIFFIITGVIYVATAYYLYKRWNESGQKMFGPAVRK